MDSNLELAKEVGALREAVTRLTDQWAEKDRAATEGRRELHRSIEGLRLDQAATKREVHGLKEEVSKEIKPVIVQYQQDKWRFEGMKTLSKLAWLNLGAFGTGLTFILYHYFGIGKPPGT